MSFATPRASPRVPAPPSMSSQDKPSYRKGYRSMNGTEIKYINDWARQHQLEGDGLIPLLYDHLNKSDRTKEHRLKFVPIPDTVIFDHNFPRAWYAYDFKANEIIKRPGKMLESQSIYEYFSGEEEGVEDPCTDIVAQFFSKKSSTNAASSPRQMRREQQLKQASVRGSMTNSAPRSPRRSGSSDTRTGGVDRTPSADSSPRHRTAAVEEEDDETGTSVEFFTKDTLYDFVFNQKVKPDGVLQRFVVPKGQPSTMRNFMLQAVWSPLVSLVYKRTSTKRMSDHTGSSISERAATFDGPPHYSTESLVAQGTKDSLDAICKRIVKHFFITEHKPITRMVLYFKIDQLGNHILLWASSIRVGGDKLNPSYLRVPMQLAIKVDNARSCNKGDIDPDTKLLRDVLKEDVAMYSLTGDVAFAHMCRETVTGKRGGEMMWKTQAEGADTIASSEDHRSEELNNPPPSNSRQQSPNNGGQSPTDRAGSEQSGDSPRNSPRRFYVSSRAPFLIQDYPPEDLPVKSPRHPLHQAYLDLYGEKTAPSTDNSQIGGSTMGGSVVGRQSRRKRNIVQAQQRAGTLSAAERLAKRTDKELLLAQMKEAIADCVYQAYSSTLEGATSVGLGVIPQVSVMVELDDILYSTLDQHQLKDVLELAKLIPDRTDDTMFTDQERSEFQRQQLRAATKNGVGVVGSSGRKSFLVGYDTSAQPALAGRPPPRRNPLIKKEMIKEGIDVDQLDADQRDAAVEYSQRKARLKQEERAGDSSQQQRRITNNHTHHDEDPINDNTHNNHQGGGYGGDYSSDEDSDVKYALISEEEHRMEKYRSGMKFTVVPGTLGRGFRRDRPIAQIIRDVEDYLTGLFESAEVAEDIMNRHEAATVEGEHNRQEMIKHQSGNSPTAATNVEAKVPAVSTTTHDANANDVNDVNAASTTSDNISDVPTASTQNESSFAQRSASARSEVASHSMKE